MTREEIRSGIDAVLESLDAVLDQAADRGFDVSHIRELSREITDELAGEGSPRLPLAV